MEIGERSSCSKLSMVPEGARAELREFCRGSSHLSYGLPAAVLKKQHLHQMPKAVDMHDSDLSTNGQGD
jgi:hypothetical protein